MRDAIVAEARTWLRSIVGGLKLLSPLELAAELLDEALERHRETRIAHTGAKACLEVFAQVLATARAANGTNDRRAMEKALDRLLTEAKLASSYYAEVSDHHRDVGRAIAASQRAVVAAAKGSHPFPGMNS
ncbi:MAG: hypothetical protein ACRD3Q_02970 [Terriglobales bacterium]